MAARTATLEVKVTGDASGASRAMDQVSGGAGKFQSGMGKAAKVAAIGGAALFAFGKQAFDAASEAQQAAGAVDAVFGKSAGSVHAFAKKSADATGLAASEYESMASVFGAQLKNMGVDSKKLAPQTDDLISLGADLAAQFGGPTSDAVGALSSLLRGETDPIEKYGVSIKEADKEAYKAAHGLDGLTGKAEKQADTQAILALLTEQTASAQGAFGREANTAAGQQARANAKFKDATAALGTALLPIIQEVAGWMTKLAGFVERNASVFQILIPILAGAALAIWAVNAAMAANPVTLIIIGIAALIAGIVLLIKNWDKVTAAFRWFWNWLKQNWPKLLVIIMGPFGLAIAWIIRNWKKVVGVFRAFGRVAASVFRAVKNVALTIFRAVRDVILKVIDAAKRVVAFVKDKFSAAFRFARDVARTVFQTIREIILRVIDAVVRVVGAIRDRFLGAIRTARDVVASVFQAIREIIVRTIDAIQRVIGKVRDGLGGAFRAVRDVAKSAFDAIKDAIQSVFDLAQKLSSYLQNSLSWAFNAAKSVATSAFNAILAPIQWVIDKVKSLIDILGNIPTPHIDWPSPPSWVPIIGGSSAPAPARYAAPVVRRGVGAQAQVSAAAGAGGITINVTGALDADAVARQIERILLSRSRRVGGVRTSVRPLV